MHVKVGDVSAAHGARYFLIGTQARTHNDGDWGGTRREWPTFWHMSRAYTHSNNGCGRGRSGTEPKSIIISLKGERAFWRRIVATLFHRSDKSNPISQALNSLPGGRQTSESRTLSMLRRSLCVVACLSTSHVFISDGDNDLYVFRRKISISLARLEPGES